MCASLPVCHDLRPRQAPDIQSLRCLLIGFRLFHGVAACSSLVTRLYIFRSGASPPMARRVPCVRLRRIVRLLTFPLQRQHLVRVVDYSLPDEVILLARGTKLRLAHGKPRGETALPATACLGVALLREDGPAAPTSPASGAWGLFRRRRPSQPIRCQELQPAALRISGDVGGRRALPRTADANGVA